MVFAWRVPGGSFRRMAIGVLVASGLFAGAASLVRVKGPDRRAVPRESARVVVLRTSDPASQEYPASRELLDWARFHSPFPDRWEPAPEGRLSAEMAQVTIDLEQESSYEARLRPRLVVPEEPQLPGLIGGAPFGIAVLAPPDAGERLVAVDLPVHAVSVAEDELAKRWGRRAARWEGDNALELMGSEARFMVGVTPEGVVEMCMLVDKSESVSKESDADLERWLREQKLEPDAKSDGMVWGMVRIRLEPTLEPGGAG